MAVGLSPIRWFASSNITDAHKKELFLLTGKKLITLMVHDEKAAPAFAFLLTQLTYPEMPIPLGILRAVEKTPYDQLVHEQITAAVSQRGKGDLKKLLHSGMTWKVE